MVQNDYNNKSELVNTTENQGGPAVLVFLVIMTDDRCGDVTLIVRMTTLSSFTMTTYYRKIEKFSTKQNGVCSTILV